MHAFIDAALLQAGYNAAIVAIGAALLGLASGAVGSALYLRKRALISDAIAHATLPGLALAFMVMLAFGGDGRNLAGLMLGAAASAALGLWLIDAITRHTRLGEDAAIGAVLSVFFGAGVVLLSIVQTLSVGRKAGLESFLLGSTAGMLRNDALLVAAGAVLCLLVLWVMRRAFVLQAFDPGFAQALGLAQRRTDFALMGLVLAVTVVGLKLVGLVMIVALLIIPAVAARFWTESAASMRWIAGLIGALSGWLGSAVSASAPNLPAGPIIVLIATGLFAVSMLVAPARGALPALWHRQRLHRAVHRRQGLLALARGEPILEAYTTRLLQRERLIRADGVATPAGQAAAAHALRNAQRWHVARREGLAVDVTATQAELADIERVFTPDQIAGFDAAIGAKHPIREGLDGR